MNQQRRTDKLNRVLQPSRKGAATLEQDAVAEEFRRGVKKMAVKMRVSYERPEELQRIMDKLGKDVKRIRVPKQQEGRFRKVYLELVALKEM